MNQLWNSSWLALYRFINNMEFELLFYTCIIKSYDKPSPVSFPSPVLAASGLLFHSPFLPAKRQQSSCTSSKLLDSVNNIAIDNKQIVLFPDVPVSLARSLSFDRGRSKRLRRRYHEKSLQQGVGGGGGGGGGGFLILKLY